MQNASRASEILRASATERDNWGRGGVVLSGAQDQHLSICLRAHPLHHSKSEDTQGTPHCWIPPSDRLDAQASRQQAAHPTGEGQRPIPGCKKRGTILMEGSSVSPAACLGIFLASSISSLQRQKPPGKAQNSV